MTAELVAFLHVALDEEALAACAATAGPWWHNPGKQWLTPGFFERLDLSNGEEYVGYGESPFSGCIAATGPADHKQSMADAAHIARWDPARVLAEIDTKRRVIDECAADLEQRGSGALQGQVDRTTWTVLTLLAAPYADRPGWRSEWS
jgi:hypothetical protein